jgi:hypothetical protein
MSELRGLALAFGTVERPVFKRANEPVVAGDSERLGSEVAGEAQPLNAQRSGGRRPRDLGTVQRSV